jgi:hypothetical protein
MVNTAAAMGSFLLYGPGPLHSLKQRLEPYFNDHLAMQQKLH